MICQRCGQEHRDTNGARPCLGHVKLNGPAGEPLYEPDGTRTVRACTKTAMRGLTVCGSHGGSSPAGKRVSRERAAEADAARVLRRFGEPVDTSPTEALLDAVRWTAGYVKWLRDKVAEIESDDALVWGVTKETDGHVVVGNGPGAYVDSNTDTVREAKPSVWLDLLGTWHDRLVRICAEAIKAGIEERRVRLAESQGALVADVIRKILADLDLTSEQQQRAGNVVPLRLRELAS